MFACVCACVCVCACCVCVRVLPSGAPVQICGARDPRRAMPRTGRARAVCLVVCS